MTKIVAMPKARTSAPAVVDMEALTAPERSLGELMKLWNIAKDFPQMTRGEGPDDLRLVAPLETARARALEFRSLVGTRTRLREMQRPIHAAWRSEPDANVTRLAVGQMLAAIPNAKGLSDPKVFYDTLVFDLIDKGHSPHVVVLTCQHIRRTMTFCPSIAEVLAEAEKRSDTYFRASNGGVGTMLHRRLDDIHRTLRLTGGDPDPVENELWDCLHGIGDGDDDDGGQA